MSTKDLFHGSDVEVIAGQYDMDVHSIIPYASNVNPLGISPMAKKALLDNIDAISAYPERDYSSLREHISNYTKAPTDNMILGNGTSDLIRLTFDIIKPRHTLILGPTYGEYERMAALHGSKASIYMLKDLDDFEIDVDMFVKVLKDDIDLLILCNPNNPTSTLLSRGQLDIILSTCKNHNIFVMIDETYIEFVNDTDSFTAIPFSKKYHNLITLRSVSKFFAAPGIRLGYAITSNPDFLAASDNSKTPWNVNAFACVAGVMFEDDHYINLTKSLIHTERNLIYSAMSSRKSIKIFKPEANFILIKLLKEKQTASDVFEHCIRNGLMIRNCTDYVGVGSKFIRFCFLKPEQNDKLVNTLLEIV